MLFILLLLFSGLIVGYLARLSSRPVATLVNTARTLLVLFSGLCVVIHFTLADETEEGSDAVLHLAGAGFAAWALTFIVPAVLPFAFSSWRATRSEAAADDEV